MSPVGDIRSALPKAVSLTEVFEVSRLLTFASFQNVMISVWRDTPTAAAIRKIEPHVAKMAKRHPRIASLIVMESLDFRAPEQDARAEHARLTKKHEDVTMGVAMIVDGSSARHSIFRFMLSTVALLSAPTVVQKIFPSVGSAAGWLSSLEPTLDKNQLVVAVKEARILPW